MNIINLMIAILLGMSGIALKYLKAYWLISGYDFPGRGEDKCIRDKMCRSMGNFMFFLSVIVFVMVIGEFYRWGTQQTVAMIGWSVFLLAIIARSYIVHMRNAHYGNHRTNDR